MTNYTPVDYLPSGDGFDVTLFHDLMLRLRHPEEGCPWDKKQTLESMAKSLLGEATEAAEALLTSDHQHQCEELGDVFLNIMLATVIAEEQKLFTWKDVVQGVTEKLIRRHPHVFGNEKAANAEEAMQIFLAAKAKEKESHSH